MAHFHYLILIIVIDERLVLVIIVKEVIKPTIWKVSEDSRYPGRYECEGEEWEDSPYIGQSIRELVTLGQNPVAYYPSDKKYWE